jgi:hypothetical protein
MTAAIASGAAVMVTMALLSAISPTMSPPRSARFHSALAACALGAIVLALALVAFGYLLTVATVANLFHWCRGLAAQWAPWWLGWGAAAALTAIGVSAARTCRRYRRARAKDGADPVVVVAMDVPVAYSIAGRPGQIVVSSGMLARLNRDERRALFAHEQSHLRNRHHRYLRLADLIAAVPLLRPLRSQIRFAVERWADEDAATHVGSRVVVATSLGHAALAQAAPAATAAAGSYGVPARVEALLEDSAASGGRSLTAIIAGTVGLAAGIALSATQFQHLIQLGAHLCHF